MRLIRIYIIISPRTQPLVQPDIADVPVPQTGPANKRPVTGQHVFDALRRGMGRNRMLESHTKKAVRERTPIDGIHRRPLRVASQAGEKDR